MDEEPLDSLTIRVRSHGSETFQFSVECPADSYQVNFALSAGWKAQLQRLHWKASDLLPEDDAFLSEVGDALGNVLFPNAHRSAWDSLTQGASSRVLIEFLPGSRLATLLPWELTSVDGASVTADFEVKIERKLSLDTGESSSASRSEKATVPLRILHIAMSTAPSLQLHRERDFLLSVEPAIPVSFLFAPTPDEIAAEVGRFQPTVVHLSGHGSFDMIRREHGTSVEEEIVATARVMAALANLAVRFVFLSSCQSALWISDEQADVSVLSTKEFAGFTFPVDNETAFDAFTLFYGALLSGSGISAAVTAARRANPTDKFAAVSLVHYVPGSGSESGSFASEVGPSLKITPGLLRANETSLRKLDRAVRKHRRIALMAPVGFGGRTLLGDWLRVVSRAQLIDQLEYMELRASFQFLGASQAQTPGEVKVVRFFEKRAHESAQSIIVGELDDLITYTTDAMAKARTVIGPLVVHVPFIGTSIESGENPVGAVGHVIQANDLDARLGTLDADARNLLISLIGMGGISTLPLRSPGSILDLAPDAINAAQRSVEAVGLALEIKGRFHLSPEVQILADVLLPQWRDKNKEQLRTVTSAFFMIAERGLPEDHFDTVPAMCQWAVNLEDWTVLHQLLLQVNLAYQASGRTVELIPFWLEAEKHLDGAEKLVHAGNLNAYQSLAGDYTTALEEHREMRARWEASEESSDRTLNLLAARSQEVCCLIHTGKADEALLELEMLLVDVRNWSAKPPGAEANILGLFGEAHRAQRNFRQAAKYFQQALDLTSRSGYHDEDWRFLYALSSALLQGDDVIGAKVIFGILESVLRDRPNSEILSLYYHLKGKLLSEDHDPTAAEFLLKSLELDLQAGNEEASLIAMVSVAHQAVVEGDYETVESLFPRIKTLAKSAQDPRHFDSIAELEAMLTRSRVSSIDDI